MTTTVTETSDLPAASPTLSTQSGNARLVSPDGASELRACATRFAALELSAFRSESEMYNAVISNVHELISRIDRLDGILSREVLDMCVEPAVRAQMQSPFLHRAREWPRGYPGDFETIEYLCSAINHAPTGSLGYFCEQYFLRSSLATQHRNKIAAQADRITETLLEKPSARVLLVACGGGRDALACSHVIRNASPTFVINDIDDDALKLCSKRLITAGAVVHSIRGSALKEVSSLAAHAPYDLVLCGGLFDYVATSFLRRFVSQAMSLLAEDGLLFFTNIASANPYRSWMEYFADWRLIERTEAELRELIEPLRDRGFDETISKEATGLSYLVDVSRR